MKIKRTILLVASAILSAALLASCAVTSQAPATQGMDVTARGSAATEDGRATSNKINKD